MDKLNWYFKQLFPLDYYTHFTDVDGIELVVTWRMWLGNVYDYKCYKVKSDS